MKRIACLRMLIILALVMLPIFVASPIFAQDDPPIEFEDEDIDVPLDGGVVALIAAAIAFEAKRRFRHTKSRSENTPP